MPAYTDRVRSWLRAFLSVAAMTLSFAIGRPIGPVSTASDLWMRTFSFLFCSMCCALIVLTFSRRAAMTVAPGKMGQCSSWVTSSDALPVRLLVFFPRARGTSTSSSNLQQLFLPQCPFRLPQTRASSNCQSSSVRCSPPRRRRERRAAVSVVEERTNVGGSGWGGCGQMQKCLVIYGATSEFKYKRLHIEGCTAPEKRLCV